ncbi:MAG: glycosyltransferase family 4 protein [Gemmatimonadales bacterium]
MRIALFTEVYWPMVSGVSLTLTKTVEALLAAGHQVWVYAPRYPLPDGAHPRDEVHGVSGKPLFLSPEVRWGRPSFPGIAGELEVFAPDVIHLATEWAMGSVGRRVARTLGVPVVASAHTDYERYADRYRLGWATAPGWSYLRWFYRAAHVVLAPTERYRRRLVARRVGPTGIWGRGVDPIAFHPGRRSEGYRRQLGLGPDDLLVAAVGRLAPEKGLEELLDAWARIAPRHPTAHLALTGSGTLEPRIRRRGLPRLHLTGVRRDRALAEAYASADCFVMPSATETFGNVTLEAMASGLPVLAARAGGVLEFGVHGANAWLVEPRDAGALADGLDRLLADPALRRHLGRAGRATALDRPFGPTVERLLGHYRSAIAAHPSAGRAARPRAPREALAPRRASAPA